MSNYDYAILSLASENNISVQIEGDVIDAASFVTNCKQVTSVLEGVPQVSEDGSSLGFTFDDVVAKQTELQEAYTNNQYQRDRANAYPSIQEQLDMQYWDSVNGTTTWADAIAQVKADNPKPSE